MKIFIGYDPRQPVALQVLMHSIYTRASKPVEITPLVLSQLPIQRTGLTQFTYTRYLVPYLCKYRGQALFLDADMLVLDDIYKLEDICAPQMAPVCVVKNQRRFEWPSLMYFNNARCADLTPRYIEEESPQSLQWATSIGEISAEWNHLVGYDEPNPEAKLIHFTQGIPCFEETKNSEFAEQWMNEMRQTITTVSWEEIMGKSVHAKYVKAA